MRTINPVKHDQKRQQILDAAERCFATYGFRSASISRICKEAAISPGHLYHYFENKEAIVASIADRVLKSTAQHFDEVMTHDGNAIEGLKSFIAQVRRRNERGGHRLVLDMFAEAGRNSTMASVLEQHSRASRQLLSDFLRRAQREGQVDPTLDTDHAASVVVAIIDGVKTMPLRDPAIDAAPTSDMLNILLDRFLQPR